MGIQKGIQTKGGKHTCPQGSRISLPSLMSFTTMQRLTTLIVMEWLNNIWVSVRQTTSRLKVQGFNLQRDLNIAVSTYQMVPHIATGFLPFMLLYGCKATTPYGIWFARHAL